ncbi:hypothetical protein [Paracidovorax wautersii]|uniref:Uncharacterized protein n=1 Tax=Paracidovorax wautersii TaxID=1177982 RepID=A0A1I2GEN7_9BURK|nr:hypothetical protein [Paracidovorax wautersii]SFF15091.1 hypothetical protein SAMN04489711_11487 [Paracidovorax wautersii]
MTARKPPHTQAKTLMLTTQQSAIVSRLIDQHQEEGGSLLAQVYHDGMRIRVLTPEQTLALNEAISKALGEAGPRGIRSSVLDKADKP